MIDAIQYFLLGASFMFCCTIACIFWRKLGDTLSRLVIALMVVMSGGFLKDVLFLTNITNLSHLSVEMATALDIVAVPLYACILYELCCPGRLSLRAVLLAELPFVVLLILLAIFHTPVFYYIDMGLTILLGLGTATWTYIAIPRYHLYLKASFSYDDDINLRWLQSILWAFFVLLTVWGLSCIVYNPLFDIAYMISSLLIWIFICYSIYRHKSVVDELRPVIVTDKVETVPLSDQRRIIFTRIKKLIEEDHIYLNPLLKLSDIADLANTNRTYASAYFKSEVGATFYDHINGLRVKHAIGLLKDTSLRLDEISEQSGFNSRQSFHRVFLLFQHTTPSDYRAKCHSSD